MWCEQRAVIYSNKELMNMGLSAASLAAICPFTYLAAIGGGSSGLGRGPLASSTALPAHQSFRLDEEAGRRQLTALCGDGAPTG